jgi:hypothetical protein
LSLPNAADTKDDDPIFAGVPETLNNALKHNVGAVFGFLGGNRNVVTLREQMHRHEQREDESHQHAHHSIAADRGKPEVVRALQWSSFPR